MLLKIPPLSHWMPTTERLFEIGVRTATTVIVAGLLLRLLFFVIGRLERFIARAGGGGPHAMQRAHTLGGIFRSLATVVVAGGALIHALEILGWNVGPLLAGAGVLGVAIGFGAQSLVRDVIAGLFILAEDQYGVGDVVEVIGRAATVEEITVRMTRLRDENGYVHFVPNGEIRVVTNRSRGWNRVVFDIVVPAGQDLDRPLAICRAEAERLQSDPQWKDRILEPVTVLGIDTLGPAEAHIRIQVRSGPGGAAQQTARELKLRIHHALLEAKLLPGATPTPPPPPVEAPARPNPGRESPAIPPAPGPPAA
jgi:small conductance mechanosensitive channel